MYIIKKVTKISIKYQLSTAYVKLKHVWKMYTIKTIRPK